LKLDNLLVGSNFQIKICDFDGAYTKDDIVILSKGTLNYRAPEIANEGCRDPFKSDVYSLGIILFLLVVGNLPYNEKQNYGGCDMKQILYSNVYKFWMIHTMVLDSQELQDEDAGIFEK